MKEPQRKVRVERTTPSTSADGVRRLGRALIALAQAQLEAEAQAQAEAKAAPSPTRPATPKPKRHQPDRPTGDAA